MQKASTRVFEFPNCKAVVHFPVLSEEERKNRLEQLRKAAVRLLQEVDEHEKLV